MAESEDCTPRRQVLHPYCWKCWRKPSAGWNAANGMCGLILQAFDDARQTRVSGVTFWALTSLGEAVRIVLIAGANPELTGHCQLLKQGSPRELKLGVAEVRTSTYPL